MTWLLSRSESKVSFFKVVSILSNVCCILVRCVKPFFPPSIVASYTEILRFLAHNFIGTSGLAHKMLSLNQMVSFIEFKIICIFIDLFVFLLPVVLIYVDIFK